MWKWESISPGTSVRPFASTTSAPAGTFTSSRLPAVRNLIGLAKRLLHRVTRLRTHDRAENNDEYSRKKYFHKNDYYRPDNIRSRSRPSFCPLNDRYTTPDSFAVARYFPAGTPLNRPPRQFARPPVICNSYFPCGFKPLINRFAVSTSGIVASPSVTNPSPVENNTTVPPSTRAPIKFEPSTSSTFGLRGSPLSPISST